MNPISAVTWSVRALRGHSITFAGLFASAVLGLSVVAGFRHLLSRLGAPWYLLLILPFVAVGYVARKEAEWLPDLAQRRRWARRLLWGSIVLALLLALLRPAPRGEAEQAAPSQLARPPGAAPS